MKRQRYTRVILVAALVSIGIAPWVGAQDIPLRNWTVPGLGRAPSGTRGLLGDISHGNPFTAISPCRIADTRGGSFTGQAGSPGLTSFTNRVFQVAGTVSGIPTQCGIPTGAAAVSFQFTVVFPSSSGNLIAWDAGPVPNVSVLNWDPSTIALGDSSIVPLSGDAITVRLNTAAAGQTTQLVIDVNGYFTSVTDTQNAFVYTSNNPGTFGAARIANLNTTATEAHGVTAVSLSSGAGSSGLFGNNTATSGYVFGVKGQTNSTANDSAGVKGISGYGDQLGDTIDCGPCYTAGVRGVTGNTTSLSYGVLGVGRLRGTAGVVIDASNSNLASGMLGYFNGTSGVAGAFFGDTFATGTKSFVEPHATDATKIIKYVSLEGPEAGTYFRGTARVVGGQARIQVPEDFRMVTDDEGLTVQLTPIGAAASMYIVSEDLNEIVVASNRNVSFHYQVNGVRRSFKDFQPIQAAGTTFMPDRADSRPPAYLSEQQKKALISNGTYNPDGTPNVETAKAMGWDKAWAAAVPAPAKPQ